RIAIVGSEPEIYFLANRRSVTGYIYTYGMMEPQQFASQMQEEMIREIEAAKPEFVVLVYVNFSWLRKSDSDPSIFGWASKYTEEQFKQVGLVDFGDFLKIDEYWGDDASGRVPKSGDFIEVFKRK